MEENYFKEISFNYRAHNYNYDNMIRRAPVKRFVPYGQWGGGRIPLAIGNSPLLQNLHFDPMNLTIRQRRVVTSARLTGDRTPSKRQ